MKTWYLGLVGALILLLSATSAFAAPERVDVTGTLDDGATYSGYFVYDPGTSTYSQVNIRVTGGIWPSVTYTYVDQRVSQDINLIAVTSANPRQGDRKFQLRTETSGAQRISNARNGYCGDSGCMVFGDYHDGGGTGTLHVPAVPTLSQWAMILLALGVAAAGGLALAKRRQPA